MTTPVYICTGFLDSGKTTFIKDTLMKQEWIEEGPTLLLQCEEGEEEYSEKYLDENGLFLFNIEEREKLNIQVQKNTLLVEMLRYITMEPGISRKSWMKIFHATGRFRVCTQRLAVRRWTCT